jgi:trehalose-6-phosphatase
MSDAKLHVVTVEHTDFVFERSQDATALINLMEKAKTQDFTKREPGLCVYDKSPQVRYRTENAARVKAKATP